MPRRLPPIDHADWISAVREALKLTQTKFGELVEAGGAEGAARDAVAKWEGGVEPKFHYTRRIVAVAPPPLLVKFLGRSTLSAEMSDPDRTIAPEDKTRRYEVQSTEGALLAQALDAMQGEERREALRVCLNALRELENPSEPHAEHRSDRARRSK